MCNSGAGEPTIRHQVLVYMQACTPAYNTILHAHALPPHPLSLEIDALPRVRVSACTRKVDMSTVRRLIARAQGIALAAEHNTTRVAPRNW
jgi:hypothetical protein